MNRSKVMRSDRIVVTENILRSCACERVLEIGAGDYSFQYVKDNSRTFWVKADFALPCDIIINFNSAGLVMPFDDETFDLVICTEVIEHQLWPQRLLAEISRVLKPEGKLLISVPNIASMTYRIAWLLGHLPSCAASGNLPKELASTAYIREDGSLEGGHVVDFTLQRLTALLEFCKYHPITIRGSGIIWHRQLLPYWLVPPSFSSNIICLAEKALVV